MIYGLIGGVQELFDLKTKVHIQFLIASKKKKWLKKTQAHFKSDPSSIFEQQQQKKEEIKDLKKEVFGIKKLSKLNILMFYVYLLNLI